MTESLEHDGSQATRPQVAAIWFGNWHVDPRNEEWYGEGWTEWELVRAATPLFPGHRQPIVPTWGYVDDADPEYVARASAAAADAGIDAFLVDWYWYEGSPFLERPLNEAFLQVDSPTKFSLMWANHDWEDYFPAPMPGEQPRLRAPGRVDLAGFERLSQHVIDRFMTSPRYWRIDDAANFTIYGLAGFVRSMGGVEQAAAALAGFRERARQAGVGELHIAAIRGGINEVTREEIDFLGIQSVTDYTWADRWQTIGAGSTVQPYSSWRVTSQSFWDEDAGKYPGFSPNVTVGWDATPRQAPGTPVHSGTQSDELQYPYLPVITDNTPEEFEGALRDAAAWAADQQSPYITLNAWNEWTEGSALEPDNHWGTAKLDAVRRVFRPDEG